MKAVKQERMARNNPEHGVLGSVAESRERLGGFTLIELLVVMAIISMLMAIASPVFVQVRDRMKSITGAHNQRQIVVGVTLYTHDNDGLLPESVATVGFEPLWNWSEPTKLIGNEERSPGLHRAMGEYLSAYIPDAKTMFCTKAPQKYKYLRESWATLRIDRFDWKRSPRAFVR